MAGRTTGRLLLAARCLLAAGCLLLLGCGGGPGLTGAGTGFVAGDGTVVLVPQSQRASAPSFTAERVPTAGEPAGGATVHLADLRGQVVVVNVWASWCGPCRAEAGLLESAYQEYRDEGVAFLGIATRDSIPAVQAFLDRFGVTYPTTIDPDGRALLGFADTLPPNAIPTTLILDRQQRVAARVLGPVEAALLDGLISEVLAEPAGVASP